MRLDLNQAGESEKGVSQAASAAIHDLDQQRLRILRCTAQAMASSPGGLRFEAGTRPWLDGLSGGQTVSAMTASRRGNAVSLATAD